MLVRQTNFRTNGHRWTGLNSETTTETPKRYYTRKGENQRQERGEPRERSREDLGPGRDSIKITIP